MAVQILSMTVLPLYLSIIAFAISSVPEDGSQQHRYAEQLFASGNYQAARRAYKRILFYQPDTQLKDVADYRIAQTYYHQNLTQKAERLFQEFPATHPNSTLRFQSQLMLGQIQFDTGQYSLARTTLFELLHTNQDADVTAAAHYLRGWCFVYTYDWNKAIAEFRQTNKLGTNALRKKNASQLADILFNETPLSFKSPEVAGLLSTIIPGTGQLYVGKVKEGLLAAALSGTFIYLAADAVHERRYVDCAGISLVGLSFYWGNRADARRVANQYNAQRQQEFIDTLKRQAEAVLLKQ